MNLVSCSKLLPRDTYTDMYKPIIKTPPSPLPHPKAPCCVNDDKVVFYSGQFAGQEWPEHSRRNVHGILPPSSHHLLPSAVSFVWPSTPPPWLGQCCRRNPMVTSGGWTDLTSS
ncbi:hypothetical protein PoB_003366500 [Plakobranchus ocellatus]|uniref:Uncharacterized protein n=1 Tax=Plakobranchus ocellatus TaxID=259542 RepID=A0AAV4AIJ7_9GAST|nr:hypothetical protein PoB_003366500 [Plakobranchus ocellatus]